MGKKPRSPVHSSNLARVDAFGDLFRGVRAQGSLFGSSTLSAPWALHFVDGAPLTLCTVLDGAGWIVPGGPRRPSRSRADDTVVVRGPATFTFVDEIGTAAEPIACGEYCATPEQGGTRHRLGWNDCGRDAAGDATTLIVGAYPVRGEISRRLLDALPVVLRVDAGGTGDAVLDHLAAEVAVDAPGQQVVLDRLLDWMLVCTLREWFDRPGGEPPAWWAAQRDPVVGDALRAAARRTGGAVDGVVAGRPHRGVAVHAGQAVRRAGRRTTADLSHPLAHDARGGSAGRAAKRRPSRKSPAPWATPIRSGSARRSNGSGASTPASSGAPRRRLGDRHGHRVSTRAREAGLSVDVNSWGEPI